MKDLLRAAFPAGGVLRADTLRPAAGRSKLYVIFLTPRSGGTWLTELAMNTGLLGTPQEWFNDDWIYTDQPALGCLPPRPRNITDINRYVDAIANEAPAVAGLELSIFQALMLRELLDQPFDPRWLTASLYLRRRDLLAQAVSLYRSVASGRFHSYQSTARELQDFGAVEYDFDSLLRWLNFLLESECRFEEMFDSCNISPVCLYYEDLSAAPLDVLRGIACNLGVAPPLHLPATSLAMMRDATSAAWRERFVKDLPLDVINSIEGSRLDRNS